MDPAQKQDRRRGDVAVEARRRRARRLDDERVGVLAGAGVAGGVAGVARAAARVAAAIAALARVAAGLAGVARPVAPPPVVKNVLDAVAAGVDGAVALEAQRVAREEGRAHEAHAEPVGAALRPPARAAPRRRERVRLGLREGPRGRERRRVRRRALLGPHGRAALGEAQPDPRPVPEVERRVEQVAVRGLQRAVAERGEAHVEVRGRRARAAAGELQGPREVQPRDAVGAQRRAARAGVRVERRARGDVLVRNGRLVADGVARVAEVAQALGEVAGLHRGDGALLGLVRRAVPRVARRGVRRGGRRGAVLLDLVLALLAGAGELGHRCASVRRSRRTVRPRRRGAAGRGNAHELPPSTIWTTRGRDVVAIRFNLWGKNFNWGKIECSLSRRHP